MKVKNDGSLSIAVGASRKEIHWKNREVLWSELLDKLSKTQRTHETVEEYAKAAKGRQDEIKDVGGFVAGQLAGGRRKAGNVLERSMLTLDADFSKGGLWDTFTLMYDNAACVYSTHKHTPEKNRLRLVIPLQRPVLPDEYEAVARKVAGSIGIDDFDDTTFEPSRLMYWPSTSKDGEFVFEYQDGAWLDPDEVLAEYTDWRDSSMWPVSSRVPRVIEREIKKAEDPTGKDGLVGAFCRAYDIHEAIEAFLPDYYEKCDAGDGRYTYRQGSTAGGLVTYEDKWAFSHHGTDPASGRLCNAFDLVRVHLFGLKDEDVSERTNFNKRPSFLAMLDLVAEDPRAKKQMFHDRMESARNDFDDVEVEEVEDDSWTEGLEYDRKGKILQTIENAVLIMKNDPLLKKGILSKNQFRQTYDVRGELPWPKPTTEKGAWSDADTSYLVAYMEKIWDLTSDRAIRIARDITFNDHGYHPVQDYLNSLSWDGKHRAETLFIDYLGAEDNIYIRTATRKFLAAAVKRVFEPGCKFDYVVVLIGPQGIKKSLLVNILGRGWSSDSFALSGRGDKRDIEQLQGVWIMEIPELAGLYGKDADAVKSFITTRQDEVRLAYRSEKGYFPRQCVFIGTTNNHDFLTDTTGNRRFWAIEVAKQKPIRDVGEELEPMIDQIWAEAVQIYRKGEKLYFEDPNIEDMARSEQERHRETDPWEEIVTEFLETPIPPDGEICDFDKNADTSNLAKRDKISLQEVWQLALNGRGAVDNVPAKRIRRILRSLPSWEEYVTSIDGRSVRAYRRKWATKDGINATKDGKTPM